MASNRVQRRARYARTTGRLRVNTPDGLPSGMDPVVWWWGSDSPFAARRDAGLAAFTRATSLVVNTIASMPWRLLTGGASAEMSTIELPSPRWASDPMLLRPDARYGLPSTAASLRLPRSAFWAQLLRSALWYGVGYLLFEEGGDGAPLAGTLKVLNPQMVSSRVDADGYVVRRIGSTASGEWVDTDFDGRLVLGNRPYRVMEMMNPAGEVDEYGLSAGVLELHARELGMADSALDYGTSMFGSGVPSGYLKTTNPTFGKAQAEQLKEQWMAQHSGDRRSVAVLNATTEYVPIQMSPVDMALIETRQMSLTDIANAVGVPAYMLGGNDGGSNTYSNAESRNLDFRTWTLLPWAHMVEDVLSSLLPQGTWLQVDFRGLLRSDTKTRYEAYSIALRDGWLLPAEVRLLESLPADVIGSARGAPAVFPSDQDEEEDQL